MQAKYPGPGKSEDHLFLLNYEQFFLHIPSKTLQ